MEDFQGLTRRQRRSLRVIAQGPMVSPGAVKVKVSQPWRVCKVHSVNEGSWI